MGQLFRKEALERLSSPERLDQLINVVDPRAWLPLAAAGSLVVVATVWSVMGRLPLTVTGQGVLIQPRRVVQFQAPTSGQVLSLQIQPGDRVKKGDVLGKISQPLLEQQLQQEKKKLSELLQQNQDANQIEGQRLQLERKTLSQQRSDLEKNLKRTQIWSVLRQENLELLAQNRISLKNRLSSLEKILPTLRQKSLAAIAEKRESLQQRVSQIRDLLPTLEKRLEERNRLLEQQLITGDALLNAEREYFNSLTELSNLEAELTQVDLQETDAQQKYLQSLSQIDDLKGQIQLTNVQEADLQRQYLQGLNQIDELNTKIKEISSREAKLAEQELKGNFEEKNQIQEVSSRIAQLEEELAGKSAIVSQYDGRLLEVAIVSGQMLTAGMGIGSIEVDHQETELVSLIYFADKDGKQIREGMEVQVTPSIVKRERYGGIKGTVTEVSPFPVTVQNMSAIIGNENLARSIADTLARSGSQATVQVFAQLETNSQTISGYQWSSSAGPPLQLSPGTTTQVRVKIGEIAPISFVIPIFRSLTGVY